MGSNDVSAVDLMRPCCLLFFFFKALRFMFIFIVGPEKYSQLVALSFAERV